jgi:TetR/AcrR family transcriptional repressor of nem operon
MPWEKQFDRDQALDQAMHTFWAGGYESCSMETLLSAMGIQKGSFYSTFHSKHNLLVEALTRYAQQRFSLFQSWEQGLSPLDSLHKHIDNIAAEATGNACNKGCFLVNASLELSPRDPVIRKFTKEVLEAQQSYYQQILQRARDAGELLPTVNPARMASALLGLVLGMNTMARSGISPKIIHDLARQAHELLSP